MHLPLALDLAQHRALLPAAMVIALISFTEAMSSCRTLSRKCNERWDENQELIGQGLAKIASGLCGGFPVSGSFSRSALNLYVGAKSGWSTLFACACVVACLLWATPLLYYLPRAVLAAIIIVPVVGLLDLAIFVRLYRLSRVDRGRAACRRHAARLQRSYVGAARDRCTGRANGCGNYRHHRTRAGTLCDGPCCQPPGPA